MQVKITSETHIVSVNEKGAEISSVKNKEGVEFIWQGDKKIWGRHAPVLFPVVGKLREDFYIYNNKRYELAQHGFARDMEFELKESSISGCRFQLKSNRETESVYPFEFILSINYELKSNELVTTYTILNPADKLLFFSIGAHPGFNIPVHKNEKFEDYYLEFLPGDYNVTVLKDGLLSDFKKKLALKNGKLPLSTALFNSDALVFEDEQISAVSICKNEKAIITLQCANWPYFGIWSKKDCDQFLCLEPWQGVADSAESTHQLADKKGIIALEGGKDFTCSFSMIFH